MEHPVWQEENRETKTDIQGRQRVQSVRCWACFVSDNTIRLPKTKGMLLQHMLGEVCVNVGQRTSSLEMGSHKTELLGVQIHSSIW